MEKKTTAGKIKVIIVLTEHPVLGPLLIPYVAEKTGDGTLCLTEQAFHASSEAEGRMSDAGRQAVRIASAYMERNLMAVYSKEKTVARFLHKLSEDPERVRKVIRPFIEKKLLEMLELIRAGKLPLYQKQAGNKTLYAHHAYRVHPGLVKTRFSFKVEGNDFQYGIQCSYGGQPLSLTDQKPVTALTASPATLLLGMDLYFFSHIESARLLPFTRKSLIRIETDQIGKYVDNILIPVARYHEADIKGMNVSEERRPCVPELQIEDTVCGELSLRLSFRYGDRVFVPGEDEDMRKVVYREPSGRIILFRRDRKAEEEAVRTLTELGLRRVSDAHFHVTGDGPEATLSGWLNKERETLNGSFRILGGADGVPYCMDEIRVERSVDEGPDWFELRVTVLVGGMRIPFYRFRRHILEGRREFLLPDGRMILLPEEWFSQYANVLDIGTRTGKGIRVRRSQGGAIPELLARLPRGRFPDKSRIAETPVPEGLKATLRPYQRKGFSWMETLRELGFGGCLADDMGLGKTLQTLALLQRVYASGEETPETEEASAEAKPACPAPETLEMDETGQLSLFPQDGDGDSAPLSDEPREVSRVRAVRKPATLIVAPTSLLHNWRREAKRFTSLSVAEYSATMSVSPQHPERFFGRYNLILTSYGIMRNRIETLRAYRFEYVVLDESQYIKSSDSLTFQAAIQLRCERRLTLTGTPVENSLKDLWAQFRFLQPDLLGEEREFHRKFLAPIRTGNKRMEARLKQLIAPFVLRRSKEEVAPELPPLTEETIFCGMTGEQKEVYEREKNSLRNFLLGHSGQADKGRPFSVLNGILRLRQLACHPRIVSPEFTGTSDKTEQIVETFATLRSEGHKVLIFSSFVTHLEILAEAFRQRGWEYALLTGSTDDRPAEIARFTERPDVHAFFISLKAGGVGLNLTQADYVFIVDPWWNPAAEAQAIARAHRIGQQKRVIAYRFITRDSIEEKIRSLQEDKRLLADTLVNDDVPALSYDEWVELLG